MTKFSKLPTRNFGLHIPPATKAALRISATYSGMTLTQYCEAVLAEAAESQPVFTVKAVRKPS